jgi:hypothetical protein
MRVEAKRCVTCHGTAELSSARLGTEKTPLRLLLRIRGNVFRYYSSYMGKYATILINEKKFWEELIAYFP